MAQKDDHTGRNQGDMSEQEQGETLNSVLRRHYGIRLCRELRF